MLCLKTLQVLTATAGSSQRGGLGAKADRTLSLFVCLCRSSVLNWSDQENGPWCLKGTCLLIALGPVPALLPQKPGIQQLERLHVHSHPGTLCAGCTSFPEDSRPGGRSP